MTWWRRLRAWLAPATVETESEFEALSRQVAAALGVAPRRLNWRVLPRPRITVLARQWGLTLLDVEGLTVGSTVLTAHRQRGLVAHELAHAYGADERTAVRLEREWT